MASCYYLSNYQKHVKFMRKKTNSVKYIFAAVLSVAIAVPAIPFIVNKASEIAEKARAELQTRIDKAEDEPLSHFDLYKNFQLREVPGNPSEGIVYLHDEGYTFVVGIDNIANYKKHVFMLRKIRAKERNLPAHSRIVCFVKSAQRSCFLATHLREQDLNA
jgi:hypothetical protein